MTGPYHKKSQGSLRRIAVFPYIAVFPPVIRLQGDTLQGDFPLLPVIIVKFRNEKRNASFFLEDAVS